MTSATLNEAERCRLRAEEYRAIASRMRDAGCRKTMEDLADTYDALASLESRPERRLTPALCQAHAFECGEFQRRLTTDTARQAVGDLAERWLELADQTQAGIQGPGQFAARGTAAVLADRR